MEFITPVKDKEGNPFALIPKVEILKNVKKWQNTLVGYVIGDKPFYMNLKACVGRMWKLKCSMEVHSRDNGFFFFKFGDWEEGNRILQGGPWR